MSHPQSAEPVRIRRLAPNDLLAIAALECEIARISFPDDPVTDAGYYERRMAKFVDDAGTGAFVAETASGIVGWALVTPRDNFATKERYGDFRSLYVVESQRGSGIAFALMRAVLDFCTTMKLSRIVGRTSFTNDAMRAIYAAYGFTPRHIIYERHMGPESETHRDSRRERPSGSDASGG